MKKFLVPLVIVVTLFSCAKKEKHEVQNNTVETAISPTDTVVVKVDVSELAKKWLITVTENYFKNSQESFDSLCTVNYAAYKNDAIGVGMDGGMSEQQFKKKWSKKFNLAYAGMGTGFMISGQDWVKITVKSCILKEKLSEDSYVFDVVIQDTDPTITYPRTIKIVRSNGVFLIADVWEHN